MHLEIGRAEQALKGEDAILQNDGLNLYGVFDGLGGHGNGDLAPQIARDSVVAYFNDSAPVTSETAVQTVKAAFKHAGQAIRLAAERLEENEHMATTASIIHFFKEAEGENRAVVGQIGDSQIIELQGYSFMHQLVTAEATKHGLTNALSARSASCEQCKVIEPRNSSRFIVCTDGISEGLIFSGADFIKEALCDSSPQKAAEMLIEKSPDYDDKSVVVIDFLQ